MSESVIRRTEREDFQATSDPAVLESADRGEVNLLSYAQLYDLWERQQWATQDLDFTQDRIDWHERIPEEERFQRMYGLSSFFIGEQKVAEELGPMMRAAPTEEMRIFLCTQIADEARHVRFFNRFYEEVDILEADYAPGPARGDERPRQPRVQRALRRDAEEPRRRPGAQARGPRAAGGGGHALPHGHRGHARAHRPALHPPVQRGGRHAAGLLRGLQQHRPRRAPARGLRRALPARDGPGRPEVRRCHDPHPDRGGADRRRRAPAQVVRGGRDRGTGRVVGGDPRVRHEGAGAPAEGDRAGAGRLGLSPSSSAPEADRGRGRALWWRSRTYDRRRARRRSGAAGSPGRPRRARRGSAPPT